MSEIPKEEAPKRLRFELVREISGETAPIVIRTKQIKKTDEIVDFPRMKPVARAYFVNKIIKTEKTVPKFLLGLIPHGSAKKVEFIARCNEFFSEALGSLDETIPKYSQELANLLLADDELQHIEGVAGLQKFKFDETLIKVALVVFAMSIPFGFLMDVILHIVPSQIVVWSP